MLLYAKLSCTAKDRRWLINKLRKSFDILANGCWNWKGEVFTNGYPWDIELGFIHHVMYEIFIGSIPRGYHRHHVCEIKTCVNPLHLIAIPSSMHNRLHGRSSIGTLYKCFDGLEIDSVVFILDELRRGYADDPDIEQKVKELYDFWYQF